MIPSSMLNLVDSHWCITDSVGGVFARSGRLAAPTHKRRREASRQKRRVAVIDVQGILFHHPSALSDLYGTSTFRVGQAIAAAATDKDVRVIILNIFSPGGQFAGLPELASMIQEVRLRKPVVAVANALAASGAYWVASAASKLFVTTSGMVGGIGVSTTHIDTSQALAKAGVKVTIIASSPEKVELDDTLPLSKSARAYLQDTVNKRYRMMLQSIAAGRGVSASIVEKNFGRGRMLMANEAVRRGMADRVQTLEEVLRQARVGLFDEPNRKRRTLATMTPRPSSTSPATVESRFSIGPEPPPRHVLKNRLKQYLR